MEMHAALPVELDVGHHVAEVRQAVEQLAPNIAGNVAALRDSRTQLTSDHPTITRPPRPLRGSVSAQDWYRRSNGTSVFSPHTGSCKAPRGRYVAAFPCCFLYPHPSHHPRLHTCH